MREGAIGMPLSRESRLAWLRLIRSENVGPTTFRALLGRFGSARAAIEALPELSRRGGAKRRVVVASADDAERELAALEARNCRLIGLGEPDYPPWLREADSAPPLLAVAGAPGSLTRPAVAIVGARNASAAGRKLAMTFARDIADEGLLVVSGLARGIDAAAHRGALSRGTVAVLAGGLTKPYPPENVSLMHEIVAKGGAIVSEMPLGWTARAQDFPRRNRIVAGMSVGILVVEAAMRSGSLITARLALQQNREVMAVPGSPLDPRAEGTNDLLKNGARLVAHASDILEAISPQIGRRATSLAPVVEGSDTAPVDAPSGSDRGRVLDALGPSPIHVDELIRLAGLPAREVQTILLELELAGRLERHPGQWVSLS